MYLGSGLLTGGPSLPPCAGPSDGPRGGVVRVRRAQVGGAWRRGSDARLPLGQALVRCEPPPAPPASNRRERARARWRCDARSCLLAARRAQATSSPHHRNSSSPPCVAPEVNKVPVAAPRAWAETSKGENHPPRATMVSPTKANVPANEPKTPNTRSRAAAEKAAKVAVVEKSLSVEKVNNSQSGTEKLSSNVKSTPIEMERVLTNASVNDSRTLKEKPTEQKTSPTAKHETQKTESKLGVSPFTCTARCAEKPAISPPSSTPRGSDEAVPVAAMTVDSKCAEFQLFDAHPVRLALIVSSCISGQPLLRRSRSKPRVTRLRTLLLSLAAQECCCPWASLTMPRPSLKA